MVSSTIHTTSCSDAADRTRHRSMNFLVKVLYTQLRHVSGALNVTLASAGSQTRVGGAGEHVCKLAYAGRSGHLGT